MVLEAFSGDEALAVVAGHPDAIDLLVTDVAMPGLLSTDLAGRLAVVRPRDTRVRFEESDGSNLISSPEGYLGLGRRPQQRAGRHFPVERNGLLASDDVLLAVFSSGILPLVISRHADERVLRLHLSFAGLGHVSPARITQIMNLVLLAPEIQERLLFLPAVERGRDPVLLRRLQAVAREVRWGRQKSTCP